MVCGPPTLSGSTPLFIAGTVLYVISVAALGILLATFTATMGQFVCCGPVLVILNVLSGARRHWKACRPGINVMQITPTIHFIGFAENVLYRAAGLDIVSPQLAALAAVTTVYFGYL